MKYLIANWKANLNSDQVATFCRSWQDLLQTQPLALDKQVIVLPSSIFYQSLCAAKRQFAVGLQDISCFDGGAHTGEVTITNLVNLVPKYVLIGHSERRRDYGETNQQVVRKAKLLWQLGSVPIICFDLPELPELAKLMQPFLSHPAIMAYEPVSAISTSGGAGNLPPEQLREIIAQVRPHFADYPLIYGGSVKAANASLYSQIVDGLLVGSASLQAESFYHITQAF